MARLQTRRGLAANLPNTGMLPGELMVTTDQGTVFVALDATTRIPVVPAVDALTALASIDGAADLIMIFDADEGAGQKAKKVTFAQFKAALAIPAGSTDEKVAAVSGGAPGFIWGTDGTDGIVRMSSSMKWTLDAGNAFVTLAVDVVDGGTF